MHRLTLTTGTLIIAALTVVAGQRPQTTVPDPKAAAFAAPAADNMTLTAVEGVKVGSVTLSERPTGCTAILFKDGTTGSVDQRGGAPGTRETDLLNPVNNVQIVNAISLAGGSAFGLDAASGVMRWLDEHNIGYPVGAAGVVPIVPAAILFDLPFGGNPKVRPDRRLRLQSGRPGQRGAGPGRQRRRRRRGHRRQVWRRPRQRRRRDESRARFGRDQDGQRAGGCGDRRGQRRRRHHRSGDGQDRRGRPRREQRAARRAKAAGRRRRPRRAGWREHHDRAGGHQRETDQGPGAEDGPDGQRRLRPDHLSVAHAG